MRINIFVIVFFFLLGCHCCRCQSTVRIRRKVENRQESTLSGGESESTNEQSFIDAYQRAVPCVASLDIFRPSKLKWKDWILSKIKRRTIADVSGASGLLWDDQGHIVTNHHCCFPKPIRITARLPGIRYHLITEYVGSDSRHDIAVLKIIPEYLELLKNESIHFPQPLDMGSSKDLQVGQICLTVGNPHGFSGTFTNGVISSLDRDAFDSTSDTVIHGCIQTNGKHNRQKQARMVLSVGFLLIFSSSFSPLHSQPSLGWSRE